MILASTSLFEILIHFFKVDVIRAVLLSMVLILDNFVYFALVAKLFVLEIS